MIWLAMYIAGFISTIWTAWFLDEFDSSVIVIAAIWPASVLIGTSRKIFCDYKQRRID